MDKLALKLEIIKNQNEQLKTLEDDYANYQESSKLNLDDNLDTDDLSHRTQAQEYTQVLDKQIHQLSDDLKKITNTSFDKKNIITSGAVAKVNGQYYIIGIPACRFDFDGANYIAMSPEAPLYKAMMGKTENESFIFNDTTFLVEVVY